MPAARMLILDPSRISDLATFSALTSEAAMPVANLRDTRLSEVWQSTSDTAQWVKMDWGQGRSFDGCFFVGHNLSIEATIAIHGSDNDADWTEIVAEQDVYGSFIGFGVGGFGRGGFGGKSPDGGTINDLDHLFLIEFPVESWQYVRFTIDDPNNPDEFISIGRLGADLFVRPGDYDFGYRITLVDPSKIEYSSGGQPLTEDRALHYSIEWSHPWTKQEKYFADIDPTLRRAGRKTDVVVAMDFRDDAPTEAQKMRWYGRFEELPSFESAQGFGSIRPRFRQSR
jgi:hypothetical protein